MARAHETCPGYSRATGNNIDVTLSLDGSALERQAA
jgi:organic hydroperoxide reductase OsmC/OhrA